MLIPVLVAALVSSVFLNIFLCAQYLILSKEYKDVVRAWKTLLGYHRQLINAVEELIAVIREYRLKEV